MVAEIVASVLPRQPERAREMMQRAAADGADWVELRLDHWPVGADLGSAIASAPLPVLATCRCARDGGAFAGSESERHALLERAVEAGAKGLDLEDWDPWQPPRRPQRLIRSIHSAEVPADLPALRDRLFAMGADVAKIVVTADDLADAAPLVDLLDATDQARQPTVAFAMGEAVSATRITACLQGAPLVYGALATGGATAPGQPTVEELRDLYRVAQLGPGTALFGVLGNPARHSVGPVVHNRAFASLGFDGVYVAMETARPGHAVSMLAPLRLRGVSVTAPHKAWAVRQASGGLWGSTGPALVLAVNTLTWLDPDGVVRADNTDIAGVRGALSRAGVGAGEGAPAAVLGTGGAARAAAFALDAMGFEVTLLGRSRGPHVLACAEQAGWQLADLDAVTLGALAPRVVVHATPVGSAGRDDEAQRLLPEWQPRPGVVVLDMVYRPTRTRLLRDAEAAGATPVPGIEMFLAQAAAQAELFTGRAVDAEQLRSFLP